MNELESQLNIGDMTLRRIGAHNGVPHKTRWLVDGLILAGGTAMLSGMPKTGKTWLMIDLAVSIASGKPFLGHVSVEQGPVMIYSPEGPTHELVHRIRQVCQRKGLDAESLDLFIIEKRQLYLDSAVDQDTVRAGIARVRPRFVVFDPLADCFSGDENRADDVKVMSRFLTAAAHEHDTTLLVTHHSGKDGAALRGSGALKAFGDSYLYLDKSKSGQITLSNEQRHGTPSASIRLALKTVDGNTAYEMVDGDLVTAEKPDLSVRILNFLEAQTEPVSQRQIRQELGGKTSTYQGHLKELTQEGLIEKKSGLWGLKKNGARAVPRNREPGTTKKNREPGTALEGGSLPLAPKAPQGNHLGAKNPSKSLFFNLFGGGKA